MFGIRFDFKELEAAAVRIGAAVDQVPYALALALNRSTEVTRNWLIYQTWPQHVSARNTSFISASLTTKDSRASKTMLSTEIYDKLLRGNLMKQTVGGIKTPQGGSSIAVPSSGIPRGQRGVPSGLRPKNLGPKAFRKNDVLYSKTSKGKLRLLYVLKRQTPIPKRVPFYEDYEMSMRRELIRTIPMAVERAMATRR